MSKLNPEAVERAKALNAIDNGDDLTLKDVGKATMSILSKYASNIKNAAAKGINHVVPDDPQERATKEAEAHINNANRADKTRYLVNVTTNKVGSFVKGAILGVKDSLNENVRGKASKGARQVLKDAVGTEEKK